MSKTVINPDSLVKPSGYSHAIKAEGKNIVYLSGQIAFDKDGKVVGEGDMAKQFEQAISNLKITIEEAGGKLQDITKLNIYITNKQAYKENLRLIGKIYQSYFGKYYPAMTLAVVKDLFDDGAMIEIEGIAVLD